MKAPLTQKVPRKAAGFSALEPLIVVAMISVLTGFAFIQIARARQLMIRANAANQTGGIFGESAPRLSASSSVDHGPDGASFHP